MKKDSTEIIGMDLGNRKSTLCILNSEGIVMERREIVMHRDVIRRYFNQKKRCLVVMEVGQHSPWVSRIVKETGHDVIVANARNVALIYKSSRKSDRVDAEQLARLARVDRALLRPIQHREEHAQRDLMYVKARGELVKLRTSLVLHIRGLAKSMGYFLKETSSETFSKQSLPEALRLILQPLMETLQTITQNIRTYDKEIKRVSQETYPETNLLQQIAGVGPITALTFLLTIGDPHRFKNNREIGAYLGLIPRKKQSGEKNPLLGITKQGDVHLRRLLVQSAHYILGPFGPDCDLRRFGKKQMEKDPKRKKRAIVAVARKLSVLLLALLKTGKTYVPLQQETLKNKKAA